MQHNGLVQPSFFKYGEREGEGADRPKILTKKQKTLKTYHFTNSHNTSSWSLGKGGGSRTCIFEFGRCIYFPYIVVALYPERSTGTIRSEFIFLYLISRKSRFSTQASSNIYNIFNFFVTGGFILSEKSVNHQLFVSSEIRKPSVSSEIDKNKNHNAFHSRCLPFNQQCVTLHVNDCNQRLFCILVISWLRIVFKVFNTFWCFLFGNLNIIKYSCCRKIRIWQLPHWLLIFD